MKRGQTCRPVSLTYGDFSYVNLQVLPLWKSLLFIHSLIWGSQIIVTLYIVTCSFCLYKMRYCTKYVQQNGSNTTLFHNIALGTTPTSFCFHIKKKKKFNDRLQKFLFVPFQNLTKCQLRYFILFCYLANFVMMR